MFSLFRFNQDSFMKLLTKFDSKLKEDFEIFMKLLSFEALVNSYGCKDDEMKNDLVIILRSILSTDEQIDYFLSMFLQDIKAISNILLKSKKTVVSCTNIIKNTERELLQIGNIFYFKKIITVC